MSAAVVVSAWVSELVENTTSGRLLRARQASAPTNPRWGNRLPRGVVTRRLKRARVEPMYASWESQPSRQSSHAAEYPFDLRISRTLSPRTQSSTQNPAAVEFWFVLADRRIFGIATSPFATICQNGADVLRSVGASGSARELVERAVRGRPAAAELGESGRR